MAVLLKDTPGAAAKMEGGHFRVPGIDINSQIRDSGTGSYTMTAWIKPDAIDGERFIFGQTNQGIHNGIRNNAFLHQAHWGADTNGSTNLNTLIYYHLSSSSNYPAGEAPANAIDGNGGTKYLNFARTNTGIIVTPQAASTVVKAIALSTANDAVERDPTSVAIYGTNDAITSADNSLGKPMKTGQKLLLVTLNFQMIETLLVLLLILTTTLSTLPTKLFSQLLKAMEIQCRLQRFNSSIQQTLMEMLFIRST